jgi:hypothetical protein
MKKLLLMLAMAALVPALTNAQSSGSFSYGNTGGTHCVLNGNNGAITGGATCSSGTDCTALGCTPIPDSSGNVCGGTINAGIKTNSGSGNVFVVRPSAVIGLLTDVSVQKNSTVDVGTSSAFAGVDFSLAVTPPAGAPAPCISPNFNVTYASRFIQISTNLFTVLGTLCTTTTATGGNSVGGTTTSLGCFITFNESTVSAHSFDWIVGYPDANAAANGNAACGTLSSGVYGIAANWKASLGNTGISESLTCVGPVNLTVTQNKIFNFNTVN